MATMARVELWIRTLRSVERERNVPSPFQTSYAAISSTTATSAARMALSERNRSAFLTNLAARRSSPGLQLLLETAMACASS